MSIQRLSISGVTVLKNPGKLSEQLVWPHNAPESSLTITRVTMQPGSISTPHSHARSEQIWIVERGSGQILTQDGTPAELKAGDIVRTPPGTAHGVLNTSNEPLVYLSITTPPEDFTKRYIEKSTT
jgi:mannose-6-phosphate isomerase-like protein (cupin superfamily)